MPSLSNGSKDKITNLEPPSNIAQSIKAAFDWANLDPGQPDPHDLCMFDWAIPDPDQMDSDPSNPPPGAGLTGSTGLLLAKIVFLATITEEGIARMGTTATSWLFHSDWNMNSLSVRVLLVVRVEGIVVVLLVHVPSSCFTCK